jgi:hypothetical protein
MPKISVITPSIRPEGLKPNQEALASQTFTDFEWLVELGIPQNGHDLNAAFNRMLKRAKGELIVFMVLWTAPLGKSLDWQKINWDWRAYADAIDTTYNCWEIDWGAAPLRILQELGGFDEELDKYWRSDNVNVGYRAYLNGYTFKNLFDNPAIAYDHNATIPHPFKDNFNPGFNKERMDSFKPGEKLPYLN